MSSVPEITIIICTYNRAKLVSACLDGVAAQTAATDRYEVIVVDNNSSDETPEAIKGYESKLPNLRYVFEGTQGLSRARNRGVEESRAPVVVYLDDDAIPYPDWIERFLEAVGKFPNAAVIGGEVEPMFESARPVWLDDDMLQAYSCGLRYSDDYLFIKGKQWLLEGNSVYRVEPLKEAGGFPEALGRKGALLLSGDGAVNDVIRRNGGELLYTPFAKIRHLVPTSRMTPTWIAQRKFWAGVSSGIMADYLKETNGEVEPWRDLLLPSKIVEWERLANLDPDKELKATIGHLYHLGFLLGRMGMIQPAG